MKNLERILARTESIVWMFSIVGTSAIGFISLLIYLDVMGRYIFNFAIQGAGEVSEYLLVFIAFLGLGYAQLTGTHVRVEILLSRLSPRLQRKVDIIVLLLVAAFFIVMTWQIGKETYLVWERKVSHWGTTWSLPTWPVSFVAFIGCILLIISFFIQLVRNILGFDDKSG